MTKITTLLLLAGTTLAQAHPSLAPHEHPHAASWLPGLDALVFAAVLGALALVVWKRVRS